jgi:hypothetical protein
LFVVELLPQTGLRDWDFDEVQIQFRHGSPDLDQMLPAPLQAALQEHINQTAGGGSSLPMNLRVVDDMEDLLEFRNPSMPRESATYFHRAKSGRTTVGLASGMLQNLQ